MRRTRVHGWEAEDRIGESEGGPKKRKKYKKSCRRDAKNGRALDVVRGKNEDKSVVVQNMSTEDI